MVTTRKMLTLGKQSGWDRQLRDEESIDRRKMLVMTIPRTIMRIHLQARLDEANAVILKTYLRKSQNLKQLRDYLDLL